MPQFPFRQRQVNTEDSPDDQSQWSPPSYAGKPIEESSEWKPPSYAGKSIDDKPKESIFSRIGGRISRDTKGMAKSFVPSSSELKNAWSKISEPLTEAPAKVASKIAKSIDEPSLKRSPTEARLRGFLAGATEAGGKLVSSLTSPLNIGLAASGIGEEIPAISQASRMATKALSTPIVAEGAENIYKGFRDRDISKAASGGLEAIMGTIGMRSRAHPSKSLAAEEELPIRQPREVPALHDTTPQQDAVAISLTKDNIPRTPANISAETGIPKPSVIRTISELKKKVQPETKPAEEAKPTESTKEANLDDFIKQNPTAKISEIEQFIKSVDEVKTPTEGSVQSKIDDRPLPTRSPNLAAEYMPPDESITTTKPPATLHEPIRRDILKDFTGEKFNEDLYNKARERLNMGKDIPESLAEPIQKTDFVNPFEKPKVESSSEDMRRFPADEAIDIGNIPKAEAEWKPPEYAGKAIETPTSSHGPTNEYYQGKKYNLEYASDAQDAASKSKGRAYSNWAKKKKAEAEAAKIPEISTEDGTIELQGGLGGFKPSKRNLEPSTGPYGAALDKLFNSMGDISEKRVQQDVINKIERARRFAAFSDVEDAGVAGAAKSLSKLKGEFEKVDFDKLKMTQPQVDSLFTAVKRANVTPGEKARGYTTLFKLFNGELPQRNELRILDDVFGNNFANRIVELHGGFGGGMVKLSKLANTMKSMENAISLAPPLRHGIGMLARKEFYPAFIDMFKFYGNKEFFDSSMQAIEEHPKYLESREAGLFLPKIASGADEEFLGGYIGHIPKFTGIPMAVAASKRAYTGFLNKLKFDVYKNMTDRAKDLGYELFTDKSEKNPVGEASRQAKGIANFINTFTGRGDLGRLNKITNELNTFLWSPRMIASRIQMFTSPKLYADLPKGMRLEGLKSLLAIASLGTIIDTASAYAGAKVSTNILSTDFGKGRFGTNLIDPWGGFQQYVVGAARFLAGKTDSSQPTSRLDIFGRFLANKESPAASLAHTMLTAKFTGDSNNPATAGNLTTEYGQKTSVQKEVMQKFTFIFVQDLEGLISSEPDWSENIGLTAAMSVASLAGMAQNYPEKKGVMSLGKMKLR